MNNAGENHQGYTQDQAAVALKVANNILEKWSCTAEEKMNLLGMKKASYYKNIAEGAQPKLRTDQVERISYILNIHAALRTVFSNDENIYGFVRMPNHNPFFNGSTPMEIMSGQNIASLYEVFKRVDNMRSGQW